MDFDIGENLKTIRKAKKLSAQEVVDRLKANGVDISKTTYYAWEEGSRPIPHRSILPLCMSLNVTVDFLYVINNKSTMLNEKIDHIKSIEAFLRNLDDNTCKMLIDLERRWNGDLKAALIMIGVYSAQPVEMRRDVANLCLHNYLCGVRDGEINAEETLDIEYYQKALDKLNKR
ncbi:MAG: helix-turn-helix domain-containing protein [Bacteroidales bacterium]|nr:helix-turn-helix domain-containing protein [Bacteroidales bacterium]